MMQPNYYDNQSYYNNQQGYIGGYPYGYSPQMLQNINYYNYGSPQPTAQNNYYGYGVPMVSDPSILRGPNGIPGQKQEPINPNDIPFQPVDYVPGRIRPVQLEDANGNSVDADTYLKGGATVSSGGFNPATGRVNAPAAGQGHYEPYMTSYSMGIPQYIPQPQQYANYSVPGRNIGYVEEYGNPSCPNAVTPGYRMPDGTMIWSRRDADGVFRFHTPEEDRAKCDIGYGSSYQQNNQMYQPQMYGYNGMCINPMFRPINGAPMSEFDSYMQNLLYTNDYGIDIKSDLANMIFSDEELQKRDEHNKSRMIVGFDMLNQPIYSDDTYYYGRYRNNGNIQTDFENAVNNYVNYYMMCSDICHGYFGDQDKVDKEKLRKRFNPFPQRQQQQMNPNIGSVAQLYSMTPEQREEYIKEQRIAECWRLEQTFNQREAMQGYVDNQRAIAFGKIRASHDRMLGFEPGQGYSLSEYLDNGYALNIAIAKENMKKIKFNAQNKFNPTTFDQRITKDYGKQLPKFLIDDDYLPIEEKIRQRYRQNTLNRPHDSSQAPAVNDYGGEGILIDMSSYSKDAAAAANNLTKMDESNYQSLTKDEKRYVEFMAEAIKRSEHCKAERAKGWNC
jgi:hypothetical protein